MSGQFKRLKSKYIAEAAVKSAALGVSFGALAAGVLLLALKLSKTPLNPIYYALIGVGGAMLCGGIIFLLIKPSDRKIALRLDRENSLGERVQTALAFQNDGGELAKMQREDAEERLSSVAYRFPPLKKLWQYILALLLSLALLVTAIALPVKKAGNQGGGNSGDENLFTLSAYQKAALEGLITDVNGFALPEGAKSEIALSLNELLSALEEEQTVSGMRTAVINCILEADGAIKGECSYFALGSSLLEEGSKELSKMLAYGAEFYKRYYFTSKVNVNDFYAISAETAEREIGDILDALQTDIAALVAGGMSEELSSYVKKIESALSKAPSTDSLYFAVESFYLSLAKEGLTAEDIKSAFDNLGYSLSNRLSRQAYYMACGKYIVNELISQFEIPDSLVNISVWDLASRFEEGGDSDGGDDVSGGGFGEGGQKYGSDDEIFDPVTGEYVKYGTILQRYYDIVQSFLNEGTLTEEQAAIVRTYFTLLFGGLNEDNKKEED